MAKIHDETNLMTKRNEIREKIEKDTNELAEAIVKLQDAAKVLETTRLKRKAILILLSHHTGLGQGVIDTVLDGLLNFGKDFLKN